MADYYTQAVCNNPDTLLFDDKIVAMMSFLQNGDFERLAVVFGDRDEAISALLEIGELNSGEEGKKSVEDFFASNTGEELVDVEVDFIFDWDLNWSYDDEGPIEIDGKVWNQRYLYCETTLSCLDAAFLRWAIKHMPAKIEWIIVEFANTCSKLRPDGFGGGGWFITRSGITSMDSASWVKAQIRLFNQMDRDSDG